MLGESFVEELGVDRSKHATTEKEVVSGRVEQYGTRGGLDRDRDGDKMSTSTRLSSSRAKVPGGGGGQPAAPE